MLDRLFGGKRESKETHVPQKFEGYNLQEGRAYILLGGKANQIKANCDGCGAPYKGPCQPACEYYSTQRLSYYVDVSNIKALNSIPEESKNTDISFILPENGSATFEDYGHINRVISSDVKVGYSFASEVVIAKNFQGGDYSDIGTLIVADDGSANLGYGTEIGKLIVGKNVTLRMGDYSEIGKFLTVSNDMRYKVSYGTEIGSQRQISHEEFVNQIIEASRSRSNLTFVK